jgi:hypothetical protein
MPEIVSRKDAVSLRLIRYFTGKPCKHGHVAERRTDTGSCIEYQRLAQRTPERRAANILYKRRLRAAAVAGNTGYREAAAGDAEAPEVDR